MDMAWIPDNYLARTLDFYNDQTHRKSFLAYPEHFFSIRHNAMPSKQAATDPKRLSIFQNAIEAPLSQQSSLFSPGLMRPEDLVSALRAGAAVGFQKQPRREVSGDFKFWELSFASCPASVFERLNGVEEVLDYGDDSHESNIRLRSEFLKYDLWIDGSVVVENIQHKGVFGRDDPLWNRFPQDSIQNHVIIEEPGEIARGERGVVSVGHDFDYALWRRNDCAANL
eukprot:c3543_g1_i2.p1 GENE.c3543_g1_i2~~c3543_g1_i2.p1  ORF type:complete len:226 (+),score=54.21 c3543_g1_i2:128-805(+)